jgi:hypothetical protein
MYNNWYLEEKVLQLRHKEMLKAAELSRLTKMGRNRKHMALDARLLNKLGGNMVKAGLWLQDRYGNFGDFPTVRIEDSCWE